MVASPAGFGLFIRGQLGFLPLANLVTPAGIARNNFHHAGKNRT